MRIFALPLIGWSTRTITSGPSPRRTATPGWRVEELAPCVEDALAWFGPERLQFGTDWPACTLAASHSEVVCAYRATVAHLPPGDRALVMGGTAARVHRLA